MPATPDTKPCPQRLLLRKESLTSIDLKQGTGTCTLWNLQVTGTKPCFPAPKMRSLFAASGAFPFAGTFKHVVNLWLSLYPKTHKNVRPPNASFSKNEVLTPAYPKNDMPVTQRTIPVTDRKTIALCGLRAFSLWWHL